MRFKRFIYSVLLVLFSLVLAADLAIWFLVPDASAAAGEQSGPSFSMPEGMSFPSGDSFPEGMSLPDGMSLPEGFSAPEGGSFPSGMTFPGSGSGSGEDSDSSGRRRPGRSSGESEEQVSETAETTAEATGFAAVLARLLPLAQKVRPYRLYILIGAALGMVLCIVRLVFIHRKLRQLRAEEEAAEAGVSLKRVALWPAFLLLLAALVLVVLLFPVNEEEESTDGAVADVRVLSDTVESKTLTSLIQSTGSLFEQEAVSLTIPASVTVSSVCVKNGDTVTAGQIVAKADETSVMKAISAVHEALDDIDSQLQKAHEAKGSTSLTAPVAGTVKVVYAEAGKTALDVMNEHGSLMLLSLDGRMAVKVPATDDLTIGTGTVVTLSDGAELTGEVAFLEEGVATVTVVDRGYAIGEQVSVKTADGALLGSGPLYVHKQLDITGYLGTITRVYRSEGSTVSAGATLISLSDTADLGDYEALLQQRSEYEDELQKLFEIYQDGYLHAPCNGVIDGLSDDLAYTPLADMVTGLTARFMSSGPADAEPEEYTHYVGEVVENAGGLLYLRISSGPVSVSSYSSLPSIPSSTMEGTYTIPGSVQIYLLSGGWNPISAADIQAGDKVLFTFDQNGSLVWVIVEHTAASATPTPSPTPVPTPTPTPSGSSDPAGSSEPGASSDPSGTPGPGGGHGGWSGGSGGGWGGVSFGGKGGGSGSSAAKKPAYTIAEQELCTVTPQEKMLITVSIDELDILSLSLGQEADLYLDALPTMGFTATVTEIDTEGENSGGNTKYSVTLALDRQAQLYPGMNGTVCFLRTEKQDVLTVPLAALEEDGTRTVVYTAYDPETDALLSPIEVQAGISDGTDVEILSGLALGEPYYYRYAESISYVTE